MKNVLLPEYPNKIRIEPTFTPEEQANFCQQSRALDERADRMAMDCCANPQNISKAQVAALAKDTYALAVQLFETELAKEGRLPEGAQEIYQLCKGEVQKYGILKSGMEKVHFGSLPKPAGSRRILLHAIEQLRNCNQKLKEWFLLSSEEDRADSYIIQAGEELLPGYGELVDRFITNIPELFVPFLTSAVFDIAEAQAECALLYQDNQKTVNQKMASEMLDIADYAYEGHGVSEPWEFRKLWERELPEEIRSLYDETTGLLTSTKGLKVWLGKKGNSIVVSYSGTDFRNLNMVYADIVQLTEPSTLYLKAAGLLRLLRNHMPDQVFYVTGHSLGGGLAQFAAAANMDEHPEQITGYGYNPAGLSMASLRHLGASRLKAAAEHMWIFRTVHDPVSAVGGKIGCQTMLPETDQNGHTMEDLKACMKKYVNESGSF